MNTLHTLALLAFFPGTLSASVIAYEPFDYPASPAISGSGGTGWTSAWTATGASGVIASPGLQYADSTGNLLLSSGLAASTQGTATTQNFRQVAAGGLPQVWVSFLFHLPASNSLYEGVSGYRGSTRIFSVQNVSTDTSASISLRDDVSGATVASGKGTFGTTHLIVLCLTDGGGTSGRDRIDLYIDPLLGAAPATPDATVNVANQDFDALRLAGQNGATLKVDEIRIGTTWGDVTPIGPDVDTDGDGLTDRQEIRLGLDPTVPDTALVAAIKANPSIFNFATPAQILASPGTLQADASGTVPLSFILKRSTNLTTWTDVETISLPLSLPAGKSFLRLTPEDR